MNEENRIMTVKFLHEWLGKLVDSGYGEIKIRCEDGYLHDDEMWIDTYRNEAHIKGMLYNLGDYTICSDLKRNVEKAFERFSAANSRRYEP